MPSVRMREKCIVHIRFGNRSHLFKFAFRRMLNSNNFALLKRKLTFKHKPFDKSGLRVRERFGRDVGEGDLGGGDDVR